MAEQARSHQASLLLLVAKTTQQAAALPRAVPVISGPPAVSVILNPSGTEAVIRQLPANVQVIDVAGQLLRPAVKPGGRGGLVLLWACLLLGFAYLVTRTVLAPPPPDQVPPPEWTAPSLAPPVLPATDAMQRLRDSHDILARHEPPTSVDGWQPQCPWCGSFSLRAAAAAAEAADQGHVCLSCGHRWPAADRESWPDTVLSHHRRHPTADPAEPT
jgi:hypothetical protein